MKRGNIFNAGIVFYAHTGALARLTARKAGEYKWLRCAAPDARST